MFFEKPLPVQPRGGFFSFGQGCNRPLGSGDAGWSSPVARQAHNLKVVGSNPTPASKFLLTVIPQYFFMIYAFHENNTLGNNPKLSKNII